MAGSRKKLVTEYKGLLREKIERVNAKEKDIVQYISNVSKETLAQAEDLVNESDKKIFLKKYQDVNGQLEVCMNTLLMISSRLPSSAIDSDSNSSSSESSDDDDSNEKPPETKSTDQISKSNQHSKQAQTEQRQDKEWESQGQKHVNKSRDSKKQRSSQPLNQDSQQAQTKPEQRRDEGRESLGQKREDKFEDCKKHRSSQPINQDSQQAQTKPEQRQDEGRESLGQKREDKFEDCKKQRSSQPLNQDSQQAQTKPEQRQDEGRESLGQKREDEFEDCKKQRSSQPLNLDSQQAQKKPEQRQDRDQESLGQKHGDKLEDNKKQRSSQPLYQSPKSRALPINRTGSGDSTVHASQSRPSERSHSSERLSSSCSPKTERKYPRHSSSPGRLGIKPHTEEQRHWQRRRKRGGSVSTYAERSESPPAERPGSQAERTSLPPAEKQRSSQAGRSSSSQAERPGSPPARRPSSSQAERSRSPQSERPSSSQTGKQGSSQPRRPKSPFDGRHSSSQSRTTNFSQSRRPGSPQDGRSKSPTFGRPRSPMFKRHRSPPYAHNRPPPPRHTSGARHQAPRFSRSRSPDFKHHSPEYRKQETYHDNKARQNSPTTHVAESNTSGSKDHQNRHYQQKQDSSNHVRIEDKSHQMASSDHSSPIAAKQPLSPSGDHVSTNSLPASATIKGPQEAQREVTSSAGHILITVKPDQDKQMHDCPDVGLKAPLKSPVTPKAPPGLGILTDINLTNEKPLHVTQQLPPSTKMSTQISCEKQQLAPRYPSEPVALQHHQNVLQTQPATHQTPSDGMSRSKVSINKQILAARSPKHQRPKQQELVAGSQSAPPSSTRPSVSVASVKLIHGSAINVVVCEVNSPWAFFVQPANSPLQQLMSEISVFLQEAGKMTPFSDTPRRGALCLARFSVDGCWYRAAITDVVRTDGQESVNVIFIDYGNQERVSIHDLVDLDQQFNKVPAQAVKVSLQNVKPAGGESQWSASACARFASYVPVNQVVCARVAIIVQGKRPCVDLTFTVPDGQGRQEVNIARLLVDEGFAEYINPPHGYNPKQLSSSAPSVSSSEGGTEGKNPTGTSRHADRQLGQSQHKPSQTQQKLTKHIESTSDGKNKSSAAVGGAGVPPGLEAMSNQQNMYQHHPKENQDPTAAAGGVPSVLEALSYHQNMYQPHVKKNLDPEAQTNRKSREESIARAKNTSGSCVSVGRLSVEAMEKAYATSKSTSIVRSVGQESGGSSTKRQDLQSEENTGPVSAPIVTAKPGMTLAQTIAAQAAEDFHDDAKSTTSNRSSKSSKAPRGSSSSMRNVKDQRLHGQPQGNSSGAKPKQQKKQYPKLAPRQLKTTANDSLLLAMSHAVSPSEFYVHLISADICKLDYMQEELKDTYENLTHDFTDFEPDVGMTCVSKFSHDNMWYRVLIVEIMETQEPIMADKNINDDPSRMKFKKTQMAKVLFVDFGNTEWVTASGIKPLANVCFDLPPQAIKCCLAHVQPEDPSKVPNYNHASIKAADKSKSYWRLKDQKVLDKISCHCSLCDKKMHNLKSFDDHMQSMSHKQMEVAAKVGFLKPLRATIENLSAPDTTHVEVPSNHYCDVCCKQTRNEQEYKEHLTSSTHILADKMARFCGTPSDTDKEETDGWSQLAIDIFKQLAPCENHKMLGWMVKQVTDEDEVLPLILSYHEGSQDVCINQELVNLGLATSARFLKKNFQAPFPSIQPLQACTSSHDLTKAMQDWISGIRPHDNIGYGHFNKVSLIGGAKNNSTEGTLNSGTRNNSKSKCPFILTVSPPPKTEEESMPNKQLNNVKDSGGYQEGPAPVADYNHEDDDGVAAMDSWDPKTSDYFSERNSFEVDDEDATAAVGYSHLHDRKFCKFYMRGQRCYRGDQCPYEHPRPGENLRDQVPVLYAPSNHSPPLPAPDEWVGVQVTSIINAFHFWVQLTWGKTTLDEIQEMGRRERSEDDDEGLHALEKSINECCKVNSRSEDPNILRAMGEVVIAKYSKNKRWYRARVIDYDETEPCLKIFYVDYGNAEWLQRCDVRSPKPEFLHLPFQAVECSLYGVTPVKGKETIARRNFEPLVMDKTLVAHIISSTEGNNSMEIHLFNTTGKHDISITKYLVQHDFAKAIPDHMLDKPLSSSRIRRVSEVDEPDSVSCHERQIPG